MLDVDSMRESATARLVGAPVVTQRYTVRRGKAVAAGLSSNAGIASYVCELLCFQARHVRAPSWAQRWAERLVTQILDEAVELDGALWWRWEKNPSRSDYFYPPDWDDTCKAIDAIRAYETTFGETLSIPLPSVHQILKAMRQTVMQKETLGEEHRCSCVNGVALRMFITDNGAKPNNAEDLMVTAVTVRSILRNFPDRPEELDELLAALIKRLLEVARFAIRDGMPFGFLSRCYFSWGLFLLCLTDTAHLTGEARDSMNAIVSDYFAKQMYSRGLPASLAKYLIADELSYARLLRARTGVSATIVPFSEPANPGQVRFLYQHRRLGHFFGSSVWSRLLDAWAGGPHAEHLMW